MLWKRGSLTPELADLVLTSSRSISASPTRTTSCVYWKGPTYKTCDARYIGRDIRDCHPEHSMECLEEILREFKAGTKDVAEGWGAARAKDEAHAVLRPARPGRRLQGHPRGERRRDRRPRARGRAGPPRLVTRECSEESTR